MIQPFPLVSRDTRTAKKAVSRLGGFAGCMFWFFGQPFSIGGLRGTAHERALTLGGALASAGRLGGAGATRSSRSTSRWNFPTPLLTPPELPKLPAAPLLARHRVSSPAGACGAGKFGTHDQHPSRVAPNTFPPRLRFRCCCGRRAGLHRDTTCNERREGRLSKGKVWSLRDLPPNGPVVRPRLSATEFVSARRGRADAVAAHGYRPGGC